MAPDHFGQHAFHSKSTLICHRLAPHHLASNTMSHKEDTIPEGYAYAWNPASDFPLEDFLKKARISLS